MDCAFYKKKSENTECTIIGIHSYKMRMTATEEIAMNQILQEDQCKYEKKHKDFFRYDQAKDRKVLFLQVMNRKFILLPLRRIQEIS